MDKHTQRRPIKPMEYEEQKASESKKAHEPSGKSRRAACAGDRTAPTPTGAAAQDKGEKAFLEACFRPARECRKGRDAGRGSPACCPAIMLGASLLIVVVLGFGDVYLVPISTILLPVDPNSTEKITVVIAQKRQSEGDLQKIAGGGRHPQ